MADVSREEKLKAARETVTSVLCGHISDALLLVQTTPEEEGGNQTGRRQSQEDWRR
jgi:hypothetical protein